MVILLLFAISIDAVCSTEDAPVCDDKGNVHSNMCEAKAANAIVGNNTVVCISDSMGPHYPRLRCATACGTVTNYEGRVKRCPKSLTPVCAARGGDVKIYSNPCVAERATAVLRSDLKVCERWSYLSCNATCLTSTDTAYPRRRRLKSRGRSGSSSWSSSRRSRTKSSSRRKKKMKASGAVGAGLLMGTSTSSLDLDAERRRRRRRERQREIYSSCTCNMNYSPVCAADAQVYDNECSLKCTGVNATVNATLKVCRRPDNTRKCMEDCPEEGIAQTEELDTTGSSESCEKVYAPVCTYETGPTKAKYFLNRCMADMANARVDPRLTACFDGSEISCRIKCEGDSGFSNTLYEVASLPSPGWNQWIGWEPYGGHAHAYSFITLFLLF